MNALTLVYRREGRPADRVGLWEPTLRLRQALRDAEGWSSMVACCGDVTQTQPVLWRLDQPKVGRCPNHPYFQPEGSYGETGCCVLCDQPGQVSCLAREHHSPQMYGFPLCEDCLRFELWQPRPKRSRR